MFSTLLEVRHELFLVHRAAYLEPREMQSCFCLSCLCRGILVHKTDPLTPTRFPCNFALSLPPTILNLHHRPSSTARRRLPSSPRPLSSSTRQGATASVVQGARAWKSNLTVAQPFRPCVSDGGLSGFQEGGRSSHRIAAYVQRCVLWGGCIVGL